MGEQNLAIGYELYGSIRDAGGQQFVCFIPSNYSHLKIKREGREGAETCGTVMSHSGGVSGLKDTWTSESAWEMWWQLLRVYKIFPF